MPPKTRKAKKDVVDGSIKNMYEKNTKRPTG